MRTLLALAASLVINMAAFGSLQLNLERAQAPPAGEVSVRELTEPNEAALHRESSLYAGASGAARSTAAL